MSRDVDDVDKVVVTVAIDSVDDNVDDEDMDGDASSMRGVTVVEVLELGMESAVAVAVATLRSLDISSMCMDEAALVVFCAIAVPGLDSDLSLII